MPNELPIACTLNATDLADRQALMAELGRDALLEARHDGGHAVLRFAAGEGVRDRVESFVAAESTCCAFLTMNVSDAPDEVVLSINAPADAELVLAEMVAAFEAGPERRG